jgi:large subunit ribosomal protein L29
MKIKALREMSDEELRSELDRLHRHLFDLRSQSVTEKLEDPSSLTKARRDIARIMTLQRSKVILANQKQAEQKQKSAATKQAV